MTNHVPNLELCKRLKEAGYPEQGDFWWAEGRLYYRMDYGMFDIQQQMKFKKSEFPEEHYAAPLVSELLEQLPNQFTLTKRKYDYSVASTNPNKMAPPMHADSSADALAEMWLWLKQEGHV